MTQPETEASRCALSCDFDPTALAPSYVCTGRCGERVVFGVSQILTLAEVPPKACARFRAELLRIFGPGGPRRLDGPKPVPLEDDWYQAGPDGVRRAPRFPPAPIEPNEGLGFEPRDGLGRYPKSRVEDQNLLETFERLRRGGSG